LHDSPHEGHEFNDIHAAKYASWFPYCFVVASVVEDSVSDQFGQYVEWLS